MEKFTYSNSGVAICCLLLLFFFFMGCQKEDQTNRTDASNANFSLLRNGDCETDCIVPGGPYFETQDSKIVTWGGRYNNANSKTIDIKYYNTETNFILEVRSTNGWSDLVIDGISVWTGGNVAVNTWGIYSFPLTNGWQACDIIDFELKVAGNGPPANFNVDYDLIGLCPDGCETSFSGEALSCGTSREATYTFIADADQNYIKIQGGLTNFTGEDAVITVTGGNLTASQSTPGGSSNRVIKVEGSVSECDEITIHIAWNSTNSGGIITGNWSAKDENGVLLAPDVSGLQCN